MTTALATRDERDVGHYAVDLPLDLVDMLDATIARSPHKIAYVDQGNSLDWSSFGTRVNALARRLAGAGVTPGARVALLCGNGISFSVAAFATWRAGAVLVPLNHRLTTRDLAVLIEDSGSTLLLVGDGYSTAGTEAAGNLVIAVDHAVDGEFLAGGADGPVPVRTPGRDAPAAIMYTSGTTGRPKGVVISHSNALQNSTTCIAVLGRTEDDRELIMVPQFNVTGLCSQTIPAVQLGMTAIMFGSFDATRALDAIAAAGATSTVGAPTMWWRLLDAAASTGSNALRGLRLALFGGAPMPTALLARMRDAMPSATFGNGYGQTETCSMLTFIGGQEVLLRPESIGKPLPITDLRLIDPRSGLAVPEGEPGEIVVRGGQVAAGYWSADGLVPLADGDGWVHTGDVGVLDRGFLVLRDRIKDVIKRGGESVFSFEVEDCIAQHPAVMEVAVLGVPDEQWGEIVVAAVVAQPGKQLTESSLRVHSAQNLARFKVPDHFEVLSELPRNAGGKVLKNELRSLLTAPSSSHPSTQSPTKE